MRSVDEHHRRAIRLCIDDGVYRLFDEFSLGGIERRWLGVWINQHLLDIEEVLSLRNWKHLEPS